jgi:hypothetical protein
MPRGYKKDKEIVQVSRELSCGKIGEERWQFQQRIGLRVPELAVAAEDGGFGRVLLRVV